MKAFFDNINFFFMHLERKESEDEDSSLMPSSASDNSFLRGGCHKNNPQDFGNRFVDRRECPVCRGS